MPFEALAWTLIILLSPTLTRGLQSRLGKIDRWWLELAGWFHAVWIPFLALILGSISARAAGILPFNFTSWLSDLLVCALAFMAAAFVRRALPHPAQTYSNPLDVLRFEPRWALYRATTALWIGDFTLSVGASLLLGVLEWSLDQRLRERAPLSPILWSRLLRLAFSSLIFWATRNLWITVALQVGLVLLVEKPPSSVSATVENAQEGRKTSKG